MDAKIADAQIRSAAPRPQFPRLDEDRHTVQFYRRDEALLDEVSRFIGAALGAGEAAIVLATPQHRQDLNRRLEARGLDPARATAQGRYLCFDAEEMLSKITKEALPDRSLFAELIGNHIVQARTAAGREEARVAIFGEMVARLWLDGKGEAVLRLERFWNELGKIHSFALLCGYPVGAFRRKEHGETFLKICGEHSAVIPGEDYALLSTDDQRLRDIAYLQQQAQALEAEVALRRSEERFRLFVEAVQDYAIFMLDPEGRVATWNVGAERIKGYQAAEIVGRHFSCFYSEEDVRAGRPERNLEVATREGRAEDEGWRVRKDGSRFWADVVITALRDEAGKLVGFGKVTRDRTERMLADQALAESQASLRRSEKSLRQLSLHLLRSQEEERRRIGREMHDSLGQYLSVLKMKLDSIGFASRSPGIPAIKKEVAECSRLAEECVKEVRTISYLLYPPLLEEMGLKSAIPWYLGGFAKRSGIETSFEAPEDFPRLPNDVELVLFRVLQESLTNVHRHSGSATAEIRLERTGESVILTVTDHGKGMPGALLEQNSRDSMGAFGVGLRGMNERLQQLGGTLDITSSQAGTEVRAAVPVTGAGAAGAPQPDLAGGEAVHPTEDPDASANLNR